MKKAALGVLGAAVLAACTYQAPVNVSPAFNVYSSYESEIPGRFVLVMINRGNLARDVRASSLTCSFHTYPVDIRTAANLSVRRTLEQVFEELQVARTAPTADEMKHQLISGVVLVSIDTFEPRFTVRDGFFTSTGIATTDLSIGVSVNGPDGRIFGTTVGASRTSEANAGGACEGGATAVGRSVELAMREALERMGERISNSARLREAIQLKLAN